MNSKYYFPIPNHFKGLFLSFLLTVLHYPAHAQMLSASVSSPQIGQEVVYTLKYACSNTVWEISGLTYSQTGPSSSTRFSLAWTGIGTGTVTATTCGGEKYSASSNVSPIPLGAPGNLRQVYGMCNFIVVAWNPVYGADGYYIDVATDINFNNYVQGYQNLQIGKVSDYIVSSGLISGTTYYIRLKAYDGYGSGAYSNTSGSPSAMSIPEAKPGSGATTTQITANWKASSGAGKYYLDVSTNSSFYTYLNGYKSRDVGNVLSTTITGLTPGTTYYYRVWYTAPPPPYNNYGDCVSKYSNTIDYRTIPLAPTLKPLSGITTTQFTANWNASNGATGYYLDVSTNPSFTGYLPGYHNRDVGNVLSATITGLTHTTIYFYRVRAYNSSGTSSSSGSSILTLPLPPTIKDATGITSTQLTVNWDPSFGASGYYIDVSINSSFTGTGYIQGYNNRDVGNVLSATITGLMPGTIYYYRVRAYTSSGGTSSNSVEESTITIPRAPTVKVASDITPTQFTANWNPAQGATGYYLDVSATGSFDKDSDYVPGYKNLNVGNVLEATITGLPRFYTYYYRFRAYNTSGTSNNSSTTATPTSFSKDKNHIITRTIKVKGKTNMSGIARLPAESMQETTVYYNGLGRPIQEVAWSGSPSKNDIVRPIIYDQLGREQVKYLPYVSSESNGSYKIDPVGTVSGSGFPGSDYTTSPQYQFYNNTITDFISNDSKPYTATVIEPSALNRILKQGAPGEAWQPDPDVNISDRSIKFEYKSNAANEVYLWELNASGIPKIAATRYYGGNQLFKTITKDEHNNKIIEYKDKQGRIILKKVQVDPDPAENTHIGWACTYYIYDDFGNLRYVFPPEMMKILGNSLVANYLVTAAHLADWAFQYKYDQRKRMSEKRIPGSGWVYMVYDTRDRLVLTQDGNQRVVSTSSFGTNREWTFIKYDVLNRPVMTGIYTHSAAGVGQSAMQAYVDGQVGKSPNVWFESRSTVSGNVHGYNNGSWPKISDASRYLSITYYDSYDFTTDTNLNFPSSQSSPYDVNVKLINPKGQVTGGKVIRLDNNTWLTNVVYYDNKYRPIYSVSQNHLSGGYDKVQMQYDFIGNLENSRHVHTATNNPTVVVNKQLIYDHANRLLEIKQKIGDNGDEVTIAKNGYNELGELVTKKLHSTDATNYKQTVDYRYNIRGWLTSINDPNNVDINGGDYFGMALKYNDPLAKTQLGSMEQFNGNISEIHWQNAQDNTRKTYGIKYDNLNRLTHSNYAEGTAYTTNKGFYNENIGGYDYNGNILSLTRSGNGTSTALIDNLTYTYTGTGIAKSNKLLSVSDVASITEKELGFKDGNTGQDYEYDANGNLTKDLNKGITNIAYNHLNLPKLITKGDSTIQYVYDATGIKLQKKVSKNSTVVKTTDYVGALVYEGTADKFLNTEEGRVVLKENGIDKEEYQYHLKDHLGNVRVTFTTADREEMTSMYLLTMEPEFATLEGETFGNLETRQVDKLYNKTVGGKASAKLNAISGKSVGPSMSLEVMPGDTVKMTVHAKYDQKASTKDAVTGIAAIVASAFTPEDATPEMSQLISQAMLKPLGASQVALFAKDNTIPKAYLNYLFFDKRMQYKKGGFQQISEAAHGKFEEITLDFAPEEEGYLMIYVANQTNEPLDVFFDQMSVEHTSGPIIRVDDYYPFGMAFNTGTLAGALTNKYLYTGMELQNELGLDWYDYGARMYDASIGRWHVQDPKVDKWPEFTPYVFTINNPINLVDLDGEDVYILYYTTGNEHGDKMFKDAAETRKKDIESGEGFDSEKDKVIMIGVSDISDVQEMTNWVVDTYSEQYGETAEVGVWSHSGLDGPIGTEPAGNDALFEGSSQMSLDGWGKIDFNWKNSGSKANFYGCNSANENASKNFALNISGLDNFRNVEVGGQSTSSYPSFVTNERVTSMARNLNFPGAWTLGGGGSTYMVGGNRGEGYSATAYMPLNGSYPKANEMNFYRNRKKLRSDYQSGKRK